MRELRGWTPTRQYEELKLEPRQIADSWSAKAVDYPDAITTGVSVGETDQTGKMEDIINLFQNRLEVIEKILREELGFHKFSDIKDILQNRTRFTRNQVAVIGIVADIRRSRSGGRIVELEDRTGTMTVFVRKDDPAAGTLVNDDVIGVVGNFSDKGDMFFANRVQYPEVLSTHMNRGGLEYDPISAAFISDLHIGSNQFLESEWDKMMKWFNSDDETALNIKYLILSGDVVDGVGVYPGHEKNLSMLDVY